MLFQNATPLRKFPPWSPNKSIAHVSLVLRLLHDMHLAISSAYVPRLPSFLKLLQNFHVLLTFDKVPNLLRLPRETTSERPKVLRPPQFFFCTFDLEMCFAPQRRAFFRHRNIQKWSEHEVFCTFWLRNVLRATKACTFSKSQLLKVLRSWGVLYILCASRHNGVQPFISHLTTWLRTRRFSEPTFRSSGATNHWKNKVLVFCDFLTFSRTWAFFLRRLSLFDLLSSSLLFPSLTLPISALHLSILLEVWLLNFLRLSLLSIYLSFYLPIYLPTYLSTYLSIYLPIYLSIYPSIHLSIYLSISLSLYLSISLSLYLSISLSLYLSISLPLYLSTSLSLYLFYLFYLSISLSLYLSISLSLHLYLYLYLHPHLYLYLHLHPHLYLYLYCLSPSISIYSQCQNYRTEPGGQKYGKIPYLCPPPGSDSERSREI